MSDTVKNAILAGVAAEERVTSTPTEPFGYGSDLSCLSDLTPSMAELSGSDPYVLVQALVRRLDTPRGSLPDDPNYGISLRNYLSNGYTQAEINSLAGRIRNELSKDDRVDTLSVTVTPSPTGSELAIDFRVTPKDSLEAFTFTLAVTSGAILLEAIS